METWTASPERFTSVTVHDSTASIVQVHMVKEDMVAVGKALCQLGAAPEHATSLQQGQLSAFQSAVNLARAT